jgi:hypothetical protein
VSSEAQIASSLLAAEIGPDQTADRVVDAMSECVVKEDVFRVNVLGFKTL